MDNGIRPVIQMSADSMRNMCLGYTGEQHAQLFRIDVASWLDKWPDADIHLMLTLPGDEGSYPAKTELKKGALFFLPGLGDTQRPGTGTAYVMATKGDTHLAASETVRTEIKIRGRGGDTLEEAPEAQLGWVADVMAAAKHAEAEAGRAQEERVLAGIQRKAAEYAANRIDARIESVLTRFTLTGERVETHPVADYPLDVITHFIPRMTGQGTQNPLNVHTIYPVPSIDLFQSIADGNILSGKEYKRVFTSAYYGGDYYWAEGRLKNPAIYKELDGTEGWYLNQNGDTSYFVWHIPDVTGIENKAYMSHYANRPGLSYSDPARTYNVFRFQNHSSGVTRLCVRPDLSDYDMRDHDGSVAKWKAYLAAQKEAGKPVQLVYFIETPSEEIGYPVEEILSSKGRNTFSSDDGTVTVSGPLDPAYQNAQQDERIEALEEGAVSGGGSYTLPIASAETLGGVKVGDGLQVDADGKVSVDEGVYELIETVTLAEDTAIERTQEPNGKPYAFLSVFLRFTAENLILPNEGNILFYGGSGYVGRCYLSTKPQRGTYYSIAEVKIDKGYWVNAFSDWQVNSSIVSLNNNDGYDYGMRYSINDYPAITLIKIPVVLPAGTKIEILGVRANENQH